MIEQNKTYTASGITARLFDIILSLSEEEKEELLKNLGIKQRAYERKPYLLRVSFETEDHEVHKAFIQDISCDGVFLETMSPTEKGRRLQIHFSFQGIKTDLSLSGIVVRKNFEGMGIQFTRLNEASRQRLQDIIDLL